MSSEADKGRARVHGSNGPRRAATAVAGRCSEPAGWNVGSSIALEMDMVLSVAGGNYLLPELPVDIAELVRSMPDDWVSQWHCLLGEDKRPVSVMELGAYLTGQLHSSDYDQVTLAIRQLTLETAFDALEAKAAEVGFSLQSSSRTPETLADLVRALREWIYDGLGLRDLKGATSAAIAAEAERMSRFLAGGDLHSQFWHWLDRFYYEIYGPWRRSRADVVAKQENLVTTALGSAESSGVPPPIGWLPGHSPVKKHPEFTSAIRDGRLRVYFWVEPFGLPDAWTVWPWELIVSTAGEEGLYSAFKGFTVDLAKRVHALSDPSRLTILRCIRHFGMANTEIADLLGLSRPTVSTHVKLLRDAGLVHSEQEGRSIRHRVVSEGLQRLVRDLEDYLDLTLWYPGEMKALARKKEDEDGSRSRGADDR